MNIALGFIAGFVSCLAFLYWLGTRKPHQAHKAATGPNSKTHTSENVVVQLRKET